MVLKPISESIKNQMTCPDENAPESRPNKRSKREHPKRARPPLPPVAADSPSPGPETQLQDNQEAALDSSLPAVEEDTGSAAAANPYKKNGKWTRSIYVDAFNLALDTVLKEEAYLFSNHESATFAKYRSLDYESQYLYVRLFLRKIDAWFRIQRLSYHSDIADMEKACSTLQSKDVGFADTDIDSLDDAASLLNLDELKGVAKDAKCAGSNKAQLLDALKRASSKQSGLAARGQLGLKFDQKGNYTNRDNHFIKKILEITGPCIRLCSSVQELFGRVHLVFYRSTEWTEKSLTTVILARTMRRNFPNYIVSRTSNIFPTRESLLEFEKSIKLQSSVDELLENSGTPTEDSLKAVLAIFESVYGRWKELVKDESEHSKTNDQDEAQERVYLRRFNAAWVYTRILHKGIYVLGRFKDYKREHRVLSELLAQKFFQPARRGGWYQRKALIEENYMAALDSPEKPSASEGAARMKKWRRRALETCEAGLQDPQTHLVYHYDLQKRVLKLEPKLRIPKREQHDFGHARLRKPTERVMIGERVGDVVIGRKTSWKDPADPAGVAECSVEEMCLSTYRSEGWKGFHCEGRIVKTLFAYLFYDIFFLYLPNVFETEFQTCPLDLFTDAFYPSRASEINHRLVEISNDGAAPLIKEIWEREHERKTCVVGLDWMFALEDLLEIVECIPGEALSTMCKVLCQEYRQRSGGMPDLFLWNYEKKECLFSEVKSENDRLSDTQRLWIHVISGAGVNVELCAARTKAKGN